MIRGVPFAVANLLEAVAAKHMGAVSGVVLLPLALVVVDLLATKGEVFITELPHEPVGCEAAVPDDER